MAENIGLSREGLCTTGGKVPAKDLVRHDAGHQSTQVLPSVVDFFKNLGSRSPQERFASSRLWMYRHAICESLET